MAALLRRFKGRRVVTVAVVAAVAIATAGTTYATTSALNGIPDESGVFHACVNNGSGELKLVAATASCATGTSPVSWNQSGPPGPPGPSGAATTYTYRFGGIAPGTAVARAFCERGEKVTGGGGLSLSSSAGLTQNTPIADETGVIAGGETAIGWQVAAEGFWPVQAYVICAS